MISLSEVKGILEHLKPELKINFHVNSIGLFGSLVRDDFSSNSDIDILVDFDRPIGIEFIDLANYLEAKLKRKVDLVSKNGIKKKYYDTIEKDIVYV